MKLQKKNIWIGMTDTFFEIIRPGINTTIQDRGRNHLYHIGITISGAMDQKIFKLSNALVNNDLNQGAIEFAYQGPLLKLKNGNINFSITGDVHFNIIRKNSKVEEGKVFENYLLEENEQIDVISTKNSVFGYLAVEGGFNIEKAWNSYSINTKAKVGPNNGEKFSLEQKIYIRYSEVKKFSKKKIDYQKVQIKNIRVIKGTNFNYFSEEAKNKFFSEVYSVSNLSDRMGMRLEGPTLENIVNTNIKSEGSAKGVIQVPANGQPIILLPDHGTIGGYPKIAVVISADLDSVAQLPPGSKIKFSEVELDEAENIFRTYESEIKQYINKIL
tara:strand:- start:358 stop:1344 length:987 start_codon:yes stop_codon:yes gene_type:complete